MSINKRMNHIIKELYSGNKRAFANKIGVSATVIENVVGTRQGKPSYDVLEKICVNANISAEWLLTGTGEILASSEQQNTNIQETESVSTHKNMETLIETIATLQGVIRDKEQLIQELRKTNRELLETIVELESKTNAI